MSDLSRIHEDHPFAEVIFDSLQKQPLDTQIMPVLSNLFMAACNPSYKGTLLTKVHAFCSINNLYDGINKEKMVNACKKYNMQDIEYMLTSHSQNNPYRFMTQTNNNPREEGHSPAHASFNPSS